jgi:hypothetical protein
MFPGCLSPELYSSASQFYCLFLFLVFVLKGLNLSLFVFVIDLRIVTCNILISIVGFLQSVAVSVFTASEHKQQQQLKPQQNEELLSD